MSCKKHLLLHLLVYTKPACYMHLHVQKENNFCMNKQGMKFDLKGPSCLEA